MGRIKQTQALILASASPLRRQLLQSTAMEFDVMPSPYDEDAHKEEVAHLSIPSQGLYLACGKAKAVSDLYPEHWVIGADQIGEFEKQPLFKPKSRDDAIDMLFAMQGKKHEQHCAACVYVGGEKVKTFIDTVVMTMRTLSRCEVEAYVDLDDPLACCGSYRYEGLGKYLFERVDGCYESVLGLPLLDLLNFLQDAGVVRLLKD
jgi:septum formation protein